MTIFLKDAAKLPGSLLVGAVGDADEEMRAHHEHVPAIDGSRSPDAHSPAVPGQDGFDRIRLAPSGLGPGIRDDGHVRRHHGGVLHEVCIRVAQQTIQHDRLQTQRSQRLNICLVLLHDQFVAGRPKIGGGEALGEILPGSSGYGVCEHIPCSSGPPSMPRGNRS